MITLSNGHSFKCMVASGALGFDGKGWLLERPLVKLGLIKPELFTVVIKTLTRYPRVGNYRWWKPWDSIRLIPGGSVNKIDLTNPGIEWWCKEIGPRLESAIPLVGSIFGDQKELVEMAEMFNRFDLVGLEMNLSCPNTSAPMQTTETVVSDVKAVKRVSRHPIIIKVSVAQDYRAIESGLRSIAEAISFNSVPWEIAFPEKKSPLWRLEERVGGGGGGVSGEPAQRFNWEALVKLVIFGSLPVIGPDIMDFEDVGQVRALGARAVSFGAIHLRTPWKPTTIVERDSLESRKSRTRGDLFYLA
jgi:dihydroorotate dehydrogenase